MNNPSPAPIPVKPAVTVDPKVKLSRGADKQHNREVGHLLKSPSLQRHLPPRSLPHARGR